MVHGSGILDIRLFFAILIEFFLAISYVLSLMIMCLQGAGASTILVAPSRDKWPMHSLRKSADTLGATGKG